MPRMAQSGDRSESGERCFQSMPHIADCRYEETLLYHLHTDYANQVSLYQGTFRMLRRPGSVGPSGMLDDLQEVSIEQLSPFEGACIPLPMD